MSSSGSVRLTGGTVFPMLTDEQRQELIALMRSKWMDSRLWEQILVARNLMERCARPRDLLTVTQDAVNRTAEAAGINPREFLVTLPPEEMLERLTRVIAELLTTGLGFDVVDEDTLRVAGYLAQPYRAQEDHTGETPPPGL